MADLTQDTARTPSLWQRADKAWLAVGVIALILAIFDPAQLWPTFRFASGALLHTAPFIMFAVLAIGYMKASGAEATLARAFEGRQTRMIFVAAALGGLSPFCSCEVIPFIAAMLAMGAPLGAVMAFWLSSPLMDPAMFLITAGTLGFEFALAKTVFAVAIGIAGGFATMALGRSKVFADPLRIAPAQNGCCGSGKPFQDAPVWAFWREAARRGTFLSAVLENGAFLLKWLMLAYMVEAIMLRYVPAEHIANVLGGTGLQPIVLGALLGAPAYLNGYAAVPLIDALLAQGMSNGAAMAFVIGGGVSCIPAAIAVYALVKPRVFAAYLGYAFVGAVGAGLIWNVIS